MNTAVSPPLDDAAIIRVLQASKAEAAAGRMSESDQLLARLAIQAPNHPAVLNELGLADLATQIAGELSYGERRALEFAIALAMQPKLLLLDEPMAGIGREESLRLLDVLQRLKGRLPIVLIEHDMTTVFALADRISVLMYGRVLASGPPAQIRADRRVVAAYLGDELE